MAFTIIEFSDGDGVQDGDGIGDNAGTTGNEDGENWSLGLSRPTYVAQATNVVNLIYPPIVAR